MRNDDKRPRDRLRKQLGGKCVECGSTTDLQFDHVDPSTKQYSIAQIYHQRSLLDEEIKLCQLLCYSCHKRKSAQERSNKSKAIPLVHGTERAYKKCGPPKCEECRKMRREYMRKYLRVKTPRK